jgi:predicted transposase/invertase (TIGR01784 family)
MRNTIRFDWAIKRLLRNKANFGILEGFLSELLNDDIKIDSILESESNKQSADNKANRVDLLVQNSKGELIIIEVQSNQMLGYLLRMLFGTSKLVVDNMTEAMPYREIKKIISVNIVYFNLGHGQDYVYHGTTRFVGINKNDVLRLSEREQGIFNTPLVEKVYPEYYIIKVNQFNDVAKNTLDEWINFSYFIFSKPG